MTLKSLKTGAQPNLGKSRTYQMHVSSHNRRNQSINQSSLQTCTENRPYTEYLA